MYLQKTGSISSDDTQHFRTHAPAMYSVGTMAVIPSIFIRPGPKYSHCVWFYQDCSTRVKPGLYINRKHRSHMFANMYFMLSRNGLVSRSLNDLKYWSWSNRYVDGFKVPFKHRRKNILQWLRPYGDQAKGEEEQLSFLALLVGWQCASQFAISAEVNYVIVEMKHDCLLNFGGYLNWNLNPCEQNDNI